MGNVSDADREHLFSRLESLAPLPAAEKERLLPLLKKKRLAPGDFFVRGGEKTQTLGFVEKGLLRYYYIAEDGKEFVKTFCREGDFVNSMSALLSGGPSLYFIAALEETDLITFSYPDWQSLLAAHPVWGALNKRLLETSLLRAERRERSLILDDAATRYRDFLDDFPGLEVRLKQYDIASFLGITPVFLSRLRGQPEKK